MPVVESTDRLPLGSTIPSFHLKDVVSGRCCSNLDYLGQPVLIAFLCNHCPYVVHITPALAALALECSRSGVGVLGISSNDPIAYPEDSPARMATHAPSVGWNFPYCIDSTQGIAKAFGAQCTPEFFLFDGQNSLHYHGQFDSTRPRSGAAATGDDLRHAIAGMLAGMRPPSVQAPSSGCSIKWNGQSRG